MKVIIAGCRSPFRYNGYAKWGAQLIELAVYKSGFQITEVVSGLAPGIDIIAASLALNLNANLKTIPAQWKAFGDDAGTIRNGEMARYVRLTSDPAPGGLIAIWDGESDGTHDMINQARRYGLRIHVERFSSHPEEQIKFKQL